MKDDTMEGGPSSCLRAQYYRFKGIKKTDPPSDNAISNMGNGTAIGEYLVEGIKRLGIYAGDERRIYVPEFNVSGKVDILCYDDDGNIIPVEVKTVWGHHGRKYTIHPPKGEEKKPKISHILQLWLYLDFYYRIDQGIYSKGFVPMDKNFSFPYGILYYHARDNGMRGQHILKIVDTGETFEVKPGIEWPITKISINGTVNEHMTNEMIYSRWAEAARYIQNNIIPPRDWTIQYSADHVTKMANNGDLTKTDMSKFEKGRYIEKGDFQCNYCDFRSKCWNGISKLDLWEGVADKKTEALPYE